MKHSSAILILLCLWAGGSELRADPPESTTLVTTDGSEVVIHRDAWGVPHVYGSTEPGVFF